MEEKNNDNDSIISELSSRPNSARILSRADSDFDSVIAALCSGQLIAVAKRGQADTTRSALNVEDIFAKAIQKVKSLEEKFRDQEDSTTKLQNQCDLLQKRIDDKGSVASSPPKTYVKMMETEKETLMERYKRMQLKHVNEFNLATRKMKGIEEELARRDERIRALEQKFLGLYSSQPTKDNKKFRMIE